MSILVVCPGCRKSFKVSDKFAGKSGPCPNCKHTLHVPEKQAEVTVHAPMDFASGGKSATGKLVLKPIEYRQTKFEPVQVTIVVASVLVVLAATWLGGRMGMFHSAVVLGVGLLLISPFLSVGGYAILRNDELEPYRGKELWIRASLCGLAYMGLWGVFSMLAARGAVTGDLWAWVLILPPFILAGGMAAFAALDLEFGNAVFHYLFYVFVTVLLHRLAGLQWVWHVTNS